MSEGGRWDVRRLADPAQWLKGVFRVGVAVLALMGAWSLIHGWLFEPQLEVVITNRSSGALEDGQLRRFPAWVASIPAGDSVVFRLNDMPEGDYLLDFRRADGSLANVDVGYADWDRSRLRVTVTDSSSVVED